MTLTSENTQTHRQAYVPAVDVVEAENAVALTIALPGVDEKDMDVEVHESVLTVTANAASSSPEGYQPLFREFGPKTYKRSFSLPDHLDVDKIQAEAKHGVLRLEIPFVEVAQPRKIAVNSPS